MIKHRCYKVPTKGLDLFLTALWVNFSEANFKSEVKWLFKDGDFYDVVVGFNKDYFIMEERIAKFVREMKDEKEPDRQAPVMFGCPKCYATNIRAVEHASGKFHASIQCLTCNFSAPLPEWEELQQKVMK